MKELLKNYCELVINGGICLQKGQTLVINSPVECAEVVRELAEAAYAAGAKEVIAKWNDEKLQRLTYLNADPQIFESFPKWRKMELEKLSEGGAAFLSVSASDPEIFKGVDPARLKAASISAAKATKLYRKRTMANENQWCVISVPTDGWAKKVFPEESSSEKAKEKLWRAIFSASRADGKDARADWEAHRQNLEDKSAILNAHNFKALRYKNSLGTDFTVGLPGGHIWVGGSSLSTSGVMFSPNIPTEEVFTAPRHDEGDGVIRASKPLVYNGNLIENFTLWLKKGKVTKVHAEKNQECLEALIANHKNADRLGEIALVPHDSPVSNSGILFFNTLYDENASCHFALGSAYTECVAGADGKSDKELAELGLNCSATHHDFMVGTADMEIVGIKPDGSTVAVFENGNFAV